MSVSVRLLTPVWGPRYVEIFLRTGLPSILSSRNLPLVAAEYPTEFVFLTREIDAELIQKHPAYAALQKVCAVKFLFIDDLLLPGMEGYVLTLCFSRGIQDAGAAMVDTYFLFMNADFVVSDGAYETLLRHMRQGHRAVIAPSLRCSSEDAFPLLAERLDEQTHTLTLSAREMVSATLKHLHPTAVANILEGNYAFNSATNQFFWWVDNETLIGHFFLFFMFCIRPERPLTDIPGFCDYTFVAEMCPTSEVVVLRDSDECFLMELQGRDQELHYLKFGQPSIEMIHEHLSEWTTAYHRANSRVPIVFHGAEVPPNTEVVRKRAAAFMDKVHGGLDPEPKPTRNHPYWLGARLAEERRRGKVAERTQADLDAAHRVGFWKRAATQSIVLSSQIAKGIFYAMAGRPPLVNMWHYDWQDYRTTMPLLREAMDNPSTRIAYIAGGLSRFDFLLRDHGDRCIRVEADDLLMEDITLPALERFGPADYAIAYLGGKHVAHIPALIERMTQIAAKGARIIIMIRDESFESFGSSFSRILLRQLGRINRYGFYISAVHVNGGRAKVIVRDAILRRGDLIARYGILARPRAVLELILLVPATFFINLSFRLRPKRNLDDLSCSSLVLDIKKRGR